MQPLRAQKPSDQNPLVQGVLFVLTAAQMLDVTCLAYDPPEEGGLQGQGLHRVSRGAACRLLLAGPWQTSASLGAGAIRGTF